MAEAQIRFEREDLDGIIPIGSYIGDALKRFGVKTYDRCSAEHDCVVTVASGEEFLSPLTTAETEYFKEAGRQPGERLACHAKIERAGELVIMTKDRKKAEEPKKEEAGGEEYRKQFAEMPLEQKITELVKLEAIALGETFSFILNSPYAVFEKVGDVMAEFGMKLENKAKEARRPPEHAAAGDENSGKASAKENGEPTADSKKKKA